ncbi:MAG TPA: hypothetical protein HA300_08310 [Thermococcaceae archaeon]|nr:hypothetical protein [Thermococcaceae archaeon]
MNRESVVSDSTFYIAFLDKEEINDPSTLIKFLTAYTFSAGKLIIKEIQEKHSKIINDLGIKTFIQIEDEYDYAALLSPIGDRVFQKGEYEAIAIAYTKLQESILHSLILDDKKARSWLEKNIPTLLDFLKFSTRFIVDACIVEEKIEKEEVLKVLQKIKTATMRGAKPFNLTQKNLNIIEQLIREVENFVKN